MQLKQMRWRLRIVIVLGTLVTAAAAMASVYKFIPVWSLAPVSVVCAIAIVVVARRSAIPVDQTPAMAGPVGRLSLIWPLGLLLGGVLGVVEANRDGWHTGNIVGVIVCFGALFAYLSVYRKTTKR